jgi:hypothetical protein
MIEHVPPATVFKVENVGVPTRNPLLIPDQRKVPEHFPCRACSTYLKKLE